MNPENLAPFITMVWTILLGDGPLTRRIASRILPTIGGIAKL